MTQTAANSEISQTHDEPVDGPSPWRFCTAPMMDWSDRHCRFFWRQMSRYARLYSEMVTTGALLHGDQQRHLAFDPRELPVALQLGGSNPQELAQCARLAQDWGYSEVNLNCGCPSDRVQNGTFGACLMLHPGKVRDGLAAMRDACSIPVTLKHRLGVDSMDSYDEFRDFVVTCSESGCTVFIVHARKAWLSGLSPKENREVPPLKYDWVYRLKKEFKELTIVINGGIENLAECEEHLRQVDGVMLGRSAYHDPWLLSEVDTRLFSSAPANLSRELVTEAMEEYIEGALRNASRLNHVTRHMLGLYQRVPGARRFRRHLSENAHRPEATVDTLRAAVSEITSRAA
ncbi:MAG: tRNA dihydrouridine(20/20a) synthase DusA [Pseudomonadota bacterium]